MKTFAKILLLVALAFNASAALPDPANWYATGGTDVSTTLCYSVITVRSANGGTPVVTALNATSDKASSVVQFYTSDTPIQITTNSTTTIAGLTNGHNGYIANAIVVIKHQATDTYERRVISSVTTSTIVLTVAPTVATIPGDEMYLMATSGTIPVGSATLALDANGIYSGQKQRPLLLEVDGTSACQINSVCARFDN